MYQVRDAVCMLCARTVGQVYRGRLYSGAAEPAVRRDGRQLRCGHCGGNVYLEVASAPGEPTWMRPERRVALRSRIA